MIFYYYYNSQNQRLTSEKYKLIQESYDVDLLVSA